MSELIAGSKAHWATAPKGAKMWSMDSDCQGHWYWMSDDGCYWSSSLTWALDTSGATYTGYWKDSLMLRPTEEHQLGVMVRELGKRKMSNWESWEEAIRKEYAHAFPPAPQYREPGPQDYCLPPGQRPVCEVRDDEEDEWLKGYTYFGFRKGCLDTHVVINRDGKLYQFRFARIRKDDE